MRNTVVYVVGTVVPTVVISLAVAGVLNRKIKGIGIFRTIIFVPLAVSSVVIAVVWQFVFNTNNGCSTSCSAGSGSVRSRGWWIRSGL